jgi:leucine dehydrogenase
MGGGSIILLGDPEKIKSEQYFRALGVFIDKLKGKVFVVSESGVTDEDLLDLQRETEFVLGLPEIYDGSGDRASRTAKGVLWGMKAAAKEKFGDISLKGLKVSVRGVGYVGKQLVKELLQEGAILTVTDKVYDKIKEVQDMFPSVKVVKPDEFYGQECDIFAPCAFDNSITQKEAENMKCSIIAGSTNCSISDKNALKILNEKGVLILPGYLINSGDIIQVSNELDGYSINKTEIELKSIYYRTLSILQKAKKSNKLPSEIAIEEAENYINEISYIKSLR